MSIFQLWEKGSDQTAQAQADHLWNLFVELRKELVESQKIRSQILGFKITFLTSLIVAISAVYASKGIGLLESQNSYLLQVFVGVLFLVPAFSAIFFDFIIYSYTGVRLLKIINLVTYLLIIIYRDILSLSI
jgi:hypothetical protein